MRWLLGLALCLAACGAARRQPVQVPTEAEGAGVGLSAAVVRDLTTRLGDIARPAGGKLGVALRVLPGGVSYTLRGNERFPMASVYKFPIALSVLAKVDRAELGLNEPILIRESELSIDRSPIAESLPSEGRTMTLGELLEAMLVTSDNTASDVLLAKVGGPGAVTENLVRLGVNDIRVDRSELAIAADTLGRVREKARLQPTRASLSALEATLTDADQELMEQAFRDDPLDTATPLAMVELLSRFHVGATLSPKSTAHLRGLLERAPPRLAKSLPPGLRVAHKTGTAWGSFNDVGLVTLPDGSELAIALFLRGGKNLSFERGSQVIADAARAVYDALPRSSPQSPLKPFPKEPPTCGGSSGFPRPTRGSARR